MNSMLVEGFSGVGGRGIEVPTGNAFLSLYGGNAVFDCTTAYTIGDGNVHHDLGDNEILTESPFVDAANGDFTPVDTGNVRVGALPNVIGGGFVYRTTKMEGGGRASRAWLDSG